MMMVGPVLLFTADRSCCWLQAGNDRVWSDPPPRVWQGPPNPLHKRGLVALLKTMKPIESGVPDVNDPMPQPENVF